MEAFELWRAVGESLLLYRTRKRWKTVDVEKAGGPTYKTVQAIEAGQIGNVDSLTKHAQALGLSIVDVIDAILQTERGGLTPEMLRIARVYRKTTPRGRAALQAIADVLPVAAPKAPRAARGAPRVQPS